MSHEKSALRGSKRDAAIMIALELFTVFVGVTLAFLFDGYRAHIVQEQRQHQLEHALLEDINSFDVVGTQYVVSLRKGVAQFDSLRAAGKRPVPFFLRINGAERPPTGVWQAAMQSGAGELLDPDMMIKLASFYNEIAGEESRYARYAAFTEQRIFPLVESDTTAFYDARTGDLKPEFKGHMRQLNEILFDLEQQAASARKLHTELTGRLK